MNLRSPTQTKQSLSFTPVPTGLLQRKCTSCGQHTIAGSECTGCQKTQLPLQRRAINGDNESNVLPLDSSLPKQSHFHQDFSHIPAHATAPIGIQPKLEIGAIGDRYEQEADRIADRVMRMPEPTIQRQMEPEEEEEEMVQRQAIRADAQAKANANQVAPLEQQQESSEVPPIVHEVLDSPGQPLNPDTQTFMESRFGDDFSSVRVHNDEKQQNQQMQ